MARPAKKGLDYFPFETGFFESRKARLIRSRFGSDGLVLYIYILCKVYGKNGYYWKIDEDENFSDTEDFYYVLSDELGINQNVVRQAVEYLLNRSMFDAHLFRSVNVLTAREIQRDYVCAMRGRKKSVAEARGRFWLLSDEDESELATFYKRTNNPSFSEKNPDYSENNASYSRNNDTNDITSDDMTGDESTGTEEERKEGKRGRESYAEIMTEYGTEEMLKSALWNFIQHCQLNGRTVTNEKLKNLLVRLDMRYGKDVRAKIAAVNTAVNKGYFDIK